MCGYRVRVVEMLKIQKDYMSCIVGIGAVYRGISLGSGGPGKIGLEEKVRNEHCEEI